MRVFVISHIVEFGECDPAGIVFYPNFYRWFDRATHRMFAEIGYTFRQMLDDHDLIAWPLIDTGARFRLPVTAGDTVEIHTSVVDINDRSFRISHQVRLGGELMVDGFEVRFLGRRTSSKPVRLKTVPLPDAMRAALSGPDG